MKICYIPPKKDVDVIEGAYREVSKLDGRIRRRVQKLLTIGLGSMMCTNVLYAKTLEETIKELGNSLVSSLQFLGFYVALSMCIFDIIKAFVESDPKRIPSVLTRFAIGVGALYAVPKVLDAVRKPFLEDITVEVIKEGVVGN